MLQNAAVAIEAREAVSLASGTHPYIAAGVFKNGEHHFSISALRARVDGLRTPLTEFLDPGNIGEPHEAFASANPPIAVVILSHALVSGAPINQKRFRRKVQLHGSEKVAIQFIQKQLV